MGFIPITCATPIIMAHPMGFYKKHGLNVDVVKTAGWAVIRDKTINKEYDAAHMLAAMPLALSLGLGSNPVPFSVAAIENINGQCITLATKHKEKTNPKDWKGFKFAIPFDYSMHTYLLRYYWPSTASTAVETRSSRYGRPGSHAPSGACADTCVRQRSLPWDGAPRQRTPNLQSAHRKPFRLTSHALTCSKTCPSSWC